MPPSDQEEDDASMSFATLKDPDPSTSVPVLANNLQIEATPAARSSHLNPDWMDTLKKNFYELVIAKCSQKVREAVAKNEKICNLTKKKEVRRDLIDETLVHLMDVHGHTSKPSIAEMREIAFELSFRYPALFKDDDGHGYGLGGDRGLQGLANQMLDKLRKRQTIAKGETGSKGLNIQQQPRPKGKKSLIYGKIQFRYMTINFVKQ